jgi:hypothetical protein
MIKILLKHIDPNTPDDVIATQHGETPLQLAVFNQQNSAYNLLLDRTTNNLGITVSYKQTDRIVSDIKNLNSCTESSYNKEELNFISAASIKVIDEPEFSSKTQAVPYIIPHVSVSRNPISPKRNSNYLQKVKLEGPDEVEMQCTYFGEHIKRYC